jgi:hypothetical protein
MQSQRRWRAEHQAATRRHSRSAWSASDEGRQSYRASLAAAASGFVHRAQQDEAVSSTCRRWLEIACFGAGRFSGGKAFTSGPAAMRDALECHGRAESHVGGGNAGLVRRRAGATVRNSVVTPPGQARPNQSLELTRYGRRRKAAPRPMGHSRSAALRHLPPRSAQLQR